MQKDETPIPFAGSRLTKSRHVCAFFNSDDEAYRVLLPFVADGFACGHKAVHLLNPDQRCDHLHRLDAAGIDTVGAQESGQLDVRTNTEAYLRDGHFDQDNMLETFERLASGNDNGGYPLSRIVCRMDWAGDGSAHIDDLIEFESRVNDVWKDHEDAVICVYPLAKFGGDVVVDIMRTHPMIIIGGVLQENPFYVPPATFLTELRARRARAVPGFILGALTWRRHVPGEEAKQLRRSMNDLLSLMALPAIWTGNTSSFVVGTLLDVLLGMLDLDFVCVLLNEVDGIAVDLVRLAQSLAATIRPAEIGSGLVGALGSDVSRWPSAGLVSIGAHRILYRVGVNGPATRAWDHRGGFAETRFRRRDRKAVVECSGKPSSIGTSRSSPARCSKASGRRTG